MQEFTKTVSVLIDLSVLRRGVLTQETQIERKLKWANRNLVTLIAAWKPKPQPNESWLRQQIECLPTISRLAREGTIVR